MHQPATWKISDSEMIARGAMANARVIVGLIFREAAQRFGSGPFSYVWTLVEPSILIALMLLVRVFVKTSTPAVGDSSALFILTGFLVFRVVRATINTSGRAIQANRALLNFGMVKPPDVIIAKTVVEFTIWLFILIFFFTAVRLIQRQEVIADFQQFVLALLSIFFFCLAMSFFNATIGALMPIWRSIWKMMTMPLLFLSGVLYIPSQMPPAILNIIVWNPFLHCIEGLRTASYLDYISVYDPIYLNGVSASILLFSMAIERFFRKQILRSKTEATDDEDEM